MTSGVLCCKRPSKSNVLSSDWGRYIQCVPRCENGGTCLRGKSCQCSPGFEGPSCQHRKFKKYVKYFIKSSRIFFPIFPAICSGGCITNSVCVSPNVCRCRRGYTFTNNECRTRRQRCLYPCLNGGSCREGACKCTQYYHGNMCQYANTEAILKAQHLLRMQKLSSKNNSIS